MGRFMYVILSFCVGCLMCLEAAAGPYADAEFPAGGIAPKVDLRNMLRAHIVRESCRALDNVAEKRTSSFEAGRADAWRAEVRKCVADDLGPFDFGPLNVRQVSRHERQGYAIENVLFESLPGWDVNASVYLPDPKSCPAPWPAIIVPVGHSGKQMESYQIPAQVFARLGYVAVTFDPPDMAGEKKPGNDHFKDGVRCFLTGWSSNRYFVADALRCIDYLATRSDVDMRNGVGMTGVSGGGFTTMFATLLDDRIKASGPSCTAVPLARHPVLDAYAPCVETLAAGRFRAYDDIDVLAAALPTPLLLMAGAQDEVFKGEWSDEIAAAVETCARKSGNVERFRYFRDPGGHAYTVAMALEFVRWMDRWVRGVAERPLPAWTKDDFQMDPPELLLCKPRVDVNMFTLNRDRAVWLRDHRAGLSLRDAIGQVIHCQALAVAQARGTKPFLVWFHSLEELILEPQTGIELPATYLCPARKDWRGGALLYFDDRGRWTDLRGNGLLANAAGLLQENSNGPALMTVDLRGWGDTRPADAPYDVAGWADRSRWIAYVSAALEDAALAMRIRDGLSALAYLKTRSEIDPAKIVVGGRGMGGVVALHVAAMDGSVVGAFSLDGLASFESLATSEEYAWSHEDFLPDVLLHYDIRELVSACPGAVLVANPLGPDRKSLERAVAEELFSPSERVMVRPGAEGGAGNEAVLAFIRECFSK